MSRTNSPYGPEAVRGMDQLYAAAEARSDRARREKARAGVRLSVEQVTKLLAEIEGIESAALREFIQSLAVEDLCRDWLKMRAMTDPPTWEEETMRIAGDPARGVEIGPKTHERSVMDLRFTV